MRFTLSASVLALFLAAACGEESAPTESAAAPAPEAPPADAPAEPEPPPPPDPCVQAFACCQAMANRPGNEGARERDLRGCGVLRASEAIPAEGNLPAVEGFTPNPATCERRLFETRRLLTVIGQTVAACE